MKHGRHLVLAATFALAAAATATASPLERALDYLHARQDPLTGMVGPAGPTQSADTAWTAMAVAGAGETATQWRGAGLSLNDGVGMLAGDTIGDVLRGAVARRAVGARNPDLADDLTVQQSADGSFAGTAQATAWGILAYLAAIAPPGDARIAGAVAWLRAHQLPDGGWSATGATASDAVTTATVIQGLGAARVPAADPAIVAARARLLALRDPAGTWGRAAVPTAWAVLAIRALGERPERGVWASGGSPLRALADLQQADGGIRTSGRQAPSVFSTAVGALALGGRTLPAAPGAKAPPARAPRIVARTPADGDVVQGVLSVRYVDEAGGTGIDPAGTRIWVNGVDFTGRARITPYTLQVRASALPPGSDAVKVTVRDVAGHATTAEWRVTGGG